MSDYSRKKQKKIEENRLALEAEEAERKNKEQIKSMPNKTQYKTTAYVKDIYSEVVDNGCVKQGLKEYDVGNFERENPLAKGGHGTYAIHEYGGTQMLVVLYVHEKRREFAVDIRQKVLELNQLVRIDNSKIEILVQNNRDKKLIVTVRDTTSKYHGFLVDESEVIAQLNLICR